MNTDNKQQLEETLKYRGFGTALNKELEQHMAAGEAEFQIVHSTKIADDDISYQLHFRKHNEEDKYYFNKFDALLKPADRPGQQYLHTFYDREGITAKEAYNMLKYGPDTAVYKSMYNKEGEKYNAWLSIDTAGAKDRYNNYPLSRYTDGYYQKYPFVVSEALNKLPVPVKEIEEGKYLDSMVRSLQRGNAVNVTILHNGQEQPGILLVNAKAGKINVYDGQLQQIEKTVQPVEQQKEQPAVKPQDDVKKKPGQQVNWTKRQEHKAGLKP